MDEIQNTTVDTNEATVEDDEDLFDSASWDASEIPADEKDATDSATEEEQAEEPEAESEPSDSSEQAQPDFMTIRFNKEDVKLSKDQAIELAQKGMNYDRFYQDYQNLKPIVNEINRLAQLNNMTSEEFMLNLSQVQSQFEINSEMEALREQYPDSDESLLEELARTHIANRAQDAANTRQQEANARRNEIGRQMDIFKSRYPDVDPAKLDMSVYQLMRQNYTLLEAYETVMADKRAAADKQNASRERISKQNEENKKRSLGNISSNSGSADAMSEFEKALFSD